MIKLTGALMILVLVTLLVGGCTTANHPPLISKLISSAGWVNPSGSCEVKCVASDPDGDKLSYTWSASGDIVGEGATVTWMAPAAPGFYTITVIVTDGRGGEATAPLTINVAVNHPPLIDRLASEFVQVKKAMAAPIECVASDPDGDELSYTWSATGGNITGEGATVTWVAPNTYGTYTITVVVTDGRGGQAAESIDIKVACCPREATE